MASDTNQLHARSSIDEQNAARIEIQASDSHSPSGSQRCVQSRRGRIATCEGDSAARPDRPVQAITRKEGHPLFRAKYVSNDCRPSLRQTLNRSPGCVGWTQDGSDQQGAVRSWFCAGDLVGRPRHNGTHDPGQEQTLDGVEYHRRRKTVTQSKVRKSGSTSGTCRNGVHDQADQHGQFQTRARRGSRSPKRAQGARAVIHSIRTPTRAGVGGAEGFSARGLHLVALEPKAGRAT